MKKYVDVLFVCSGNTCRSPMAEMLMKAYVKRLHYSNVRVTSAGTDACDGDPMNEFSRAALKDSKVKCGAFKAKRVTFDRLRKSDFIVCMTDSHYLALKGADNLHTMKELCGVDVPDPYGKGLDRYLATCDALKKSLPLIFKAIKKQYGKRLIKENIGDSISK